jgi:hypothetical protein
MWSITITLSGLRSAQLFHFAGYLTQLFYYIFFFQIAGNKMTFTANFCYYWGLIFYLVASCIYGDGDLKRLKIKGPFMTGVKRFRSAGVANNSRGGETNQKHEEKIAKYDTECLVFYPIDIVEYNEKYHNDRMPTFIFGDEHIGQACD